MKYLTSLTLLLVSLSAMATEQITARQVSLIRVYTTSAIVKLAEPGENLDSCTHGNAKNYVAIDTNLEAGKEFYSAVLAARVSKMEIGFGVSGCRSWGAGTVPLVYRVDF